MLIADWLPYPPSLYINIGFGLSKDFPKVRYQFLLLLSSSFSSEVLKSGINSGSCNHEKSYKINLILSRVKLYDFYGFLLNRFRQHNLQVLHPYLGLYNRYNLCPHQP